MKNFFVPILLAVIACVTCSRSDNSAQSRFTEGYAEKWFDYYHGSVPYNEVQTLELEEFPDVVFYYNGYNVSTDKEGEDVLIGGMPVMNVYLSDLTGDGLPEFCSTVWVGSGIIDSRIIVCDYASKTAYELSDRGNYDYFLTMEDGSLIVNQVPYGGGKTVSGKLALFNGELVME